jgi:aryl-alcohol dehydrogenase
MQVIAAVSRGIGEAPALESLHLEAPRAGEMLIRLVATGICHTDLHEHPGRHSPQPIVLGHEGAGVVEELGPGVRGFEVGDHVVLSGNSCGRCPSCLASRPTYCDLAMPLCFGGKRLDGSTSLRCGDAPVHSHFFGQSSFATHTVVSERTAVKVDRDLPLEKLGPLGCGVITGAGAVIEALKVGYGDSIAIFGVGGVGLSAAMAARLAGAQHIVAVDINAERLALSLELGATHAVHADDDAVKRIRAVTGRGVRCSLNTTTVPAVHTMALEVLAMNGTCCWPAGDNCAAFSVVMHIPACSCRA